MRRPFVPIVQYPFVAATLVAGLFVGRAFVGRAFVAGLFVAGTLVAGSLVGEAAAQERTETAPPSNADVMATLVAECVSAAVPAPGNVSLDGLASAPFLRSAVFSSLRSAGIVIFEPGAGIPDLTRVNASPERLSVEYARAGRGAVRRSVRVIVRTSVSAPDGRVLVDEPCSREGLDVVDRATIPDLEDESDPRTRGELPPDSFLKRIVQPLLVATATTAGVFLFFSLRSRRAGSGE